MYASGAKSKDQLVTCNDKLINLFRTVIHYHDCSILEGHRSNEKQTKLYNAGKSKSKAGESKHNIYPSIAIDVVPYPLPNNWGAIDLKLRDKISYQSRELGEFYYFAGLVKGIAISKGIEIRWGGDWNSNNELNDQSFFDLPHFELLI